MKGKPNNKSWFLIIVLGFLILNLCSIRGNSSNNTKILDIVINTPTGEPNIRYGNPVWIRGIWHYTNITLDIEANLVSVLFYYGDAPPSVEERDETNYYNWKYDQGIWQDVQHKSLYIENNYCYHDIGFYSFYIGIDQYAQPGNWSLIIFVENEQLLSKRVIVEKELSSLVLRSIPVTIRVEPFTENVVISEEKFIVENKGNVPLRLKINYGNYEDIFSTLNFDKILKVGQIRKYSIILHSRSSWKPGSIIIKSGEANIVGEVDHVIPPKKDVSLIPSNLSLGLGINVFIGHSGYELEYLASDITFEYKKNLKIKYGEIMDVIAYISGKGNITVNIISKNLKIIKIIGMNKEVTNPFIVESKNNSEYPITVQIEGITENSTSYLYYYIEMEEKNQTYITQIFVGSPITQSRGKMINIIPVSTIIVILCIICSLGYFILVQRKHKRK